MHHYGFDLHVYFAFRDEYGKLFEFVKSKSLRVKNIGNKVSMYIYSFTVHCYVIW